MKNLLTAVLLLGALLPLRADNLITNGDFNNGTDHWQGDGGQGVAGGLIVKLQPTAWTKVYQSVTLPGNQVTLNISYSVSTDATFSSPLLGVQKGPDLGKVLGFPIAAGPISIHPGGWLIFLVDDAKSLATYVNVTPQPGTDQMQATGGTLPNLKGQPAKTLYLVFPPGEGTVILRNVSMTP